MRYFYVPLSMFVLTCFILSSNCEAAPDRPMAEKYLTGGSLKKGESALTKHLKAHPNDDQARMGLGTIQMLRGVERMSKSFYSYGVTDRGNQFIFLRVVSSENPNPKPISYQDFRKILTKFVSDIDKADQTLAKVKDQDVKLPLALGKVRLDLNGDGKSDNNETFADLNKRLRLANLPDTNFEDVQVTFDYSDCLWMRGYCHLLMGLGDIVIAHDMEEFFNRVGFLLFQEVDSPHSYLEDANPVWMIDNQTDIVDIIAAIHLINFPMAEPERMQSAHQHFMTTLSLSREMWKSIQNETDNDNEWIPNPKQTSAVSRIRMSPAMVKSWEGFLDEAEDIMQGEKLVRHWRIRDGRAVNIKKVFMEPTSFDLVMWVHGSHATPFLEKGTVTDTGFWQTLNRDFGGNFFGFAFWVN